MQGADRMRIIEALPGGRVTIVDTEGISELVSRRLTDLGIMEGTEISIRRFLPFGGPLTIEIGGQVVALRRKEAMQIKVRSA